MRGRMPIATAIAITLLAAWTTRAPSAAQQRARPNVLLIMADDPDEPHDLAADPKRAKVVADMQQLLRTMRRK